MIFLAVFLFLFALFALVLILAPRKRFAHASRAIGDILESFPFNRAPFIGFTKYRDGELDGEYVSLQGRFIGTVVGDSLSHIGLVDGMNFIAENLNDGTRRSIKPADVVVVSDVADSSDSGDRVRQVQKIDRDVVCFYPDKSGETRRSRDLKTVVGKITHIIE